MMRRGTTSEQKWFIGVKSANEHSVQANRNKKEEILKIY